jgi:CRP-like cAMP-binding protein
MNPQTIEQLAQTLRQSVVFRGVSINDLKTMIGVMKHQTFPANALLFKKGDTGDTMYVLIKGRLRIFTADADGNELTLTNYEPVRVFGDFAMLDQDARSASAQAIDTVEVLGLTRTEFTRLLPECPDLGMAMIRNLTDRVRHITSYMTRIKTFVDRLGTGDYDAALKEIALHSDDDEIAGLISAFATMVKTVQARQANPAQLS